MMCHNISANTTDLKTELTLGLPGESCLKSSSCTKGKYLETIDLRLGMTSFNDLKCGENDDPKSEVSSNETKNPPKELVVVGWPPLRGYRKNTNMMKNFKYVKVGVDGAPYLRKVNLENYSNYHQLQNALENLFPRLNIRTVMDENKNVYSVNRMEHVQTYEDKDGDWMLVGDVPWEMFVESCKKMMLVKSSETIGQAPRT